MYTPPNGSNNMSYTNYAIKQTNDKVETIYSEIQVLKTLVEKALIKLYELSVEVDELNSATGELRLDIEEQITNRIYST